MESFYLCFVISPLVDSDHSKEVCYRAAFSAVQTTSSPPWILRTLAGSVWRILAIGRRIASSLEPESSSFWVTRGVEFFLFVSDTDREKKF